MEIVRNFLKKYFLLILILVFYVLNTLPFTFRYTPFTQDEIFNYQAAKNISIYKNVWYHNTDDIINKIRYPSLFFSVSGVKINSDNKGFYPGSIGAYFIYSIFYSINPNFIYISNIVFGLIGLIFFYFIIQEISRSHNSAIFGVALLSTFPVYLTFSVRMFNNVPASTLLILSLLHYLKYLRTNNIRYLILYTIFCTFCLLIRIDYILYYFYLVISDIISNKKYPINSISIIKKVLILCLPFAIVFIFNSFLNHYYNGSNTSVISTVNMPIDNNKLPNIVNLLVMTYERLVASYYFDLPSFITNLREQILNNFGYLLLIFTVSWISLIKSTQANRFKPILLWIIFNIVTVIMLYMPNIFYGFLSHEIVLRSSYSRYLIPFYIMIIFTVSVFIAKYDVFFLKLRLVPLMILFLMSINLIQYYTLDGPSYIKGWLLTYSNYAETVDKYTEPNAVIFGDHNDVKLYNVRSFVTFNTSNIYRSNINRSVFELVDTQNKEAVSYVNELHTRNIPIYFSVDAYSIQDTMSILSNMGYTFNYISEIAGYPTYKLE